MTAKADAQRLYPAAYCRMQKQIVNRRVTKVYFVHLAGRIRARGLSAGEAWRKFNALPRREKLKK